MLLRFPRKAKRFPRKPLSIGVTACTPQELIRFLRTLRITQGRHAGKQFRVLTWEKRFVFGAFGTEIDEAALSIGRGNGKTALLGAIGLAAVAGPLAQPRGEVLAIASSHSQAKILFEHTLAFGEGILRSRKKYRILNNSQNTSITNQKNKAKFRVLANDPGRAHGRAPYLVLCDEPAQWPHAKRDKMLAALKTARGKIPGSRLIALGTRSDDDLHWFSKMLKKSRAGFFKMKFSADNLDRWDDPAQWHQANPSLKHMPDLLKILKKEAIDAKDDPALLASFKALRLNGGVSDVEGRDMLVQPELWRELLNLEVPKRLGDAPVWGVDLGATTSLSVVAACWSSGRVETLSMFGKDKTIEQRAVKDSVGELYQTAYTNGELVLSHKNIPDIGELFKLAAAKFGMPRKIVCDRYRVKELIEDAKGIGFDAVPIDVRGMGFLGWGPVVRAWRKACIMRQVRPVKPCQLLTSSLAEAVTISDPAGNEKLTKISETGCKAKVRDDVAAAVLLAVESGIKQRPEGNLVYGGSI